MLGLSSSPGSGSQPAGEGGSRAKTGREAGAGRGSRWPLQRRHRSPQGRTASDCTRRILHIPPPRRAGAPQPPACSPGGAVSTLSRAGSAGRHLEGRATAYPEVRFCLISKHEQFLCAPVFRTSLSGALVQSLSSEPAAAAGSRSEPPRGPSRGEEMALGWGGGGTAPRITLGEIPGPSLCSEPNIQARNQARKTEFASRTSQSYIKKMLEKTAEYSLGLGTAKLPFSAPRS